jgi:hypothetical protein
VDRDYSQIEELLWLYRQRVLISAQIGGPLSRVIRTSEVVEGPILTDAVEKVIVISGDS